MNFTITPVHSWKSFPLELLDGQYIVDGWHFYSEGLASRLYHIEGKPVAAVTIEPSLTHGITVCAMVVHPDKRRQGVATAIFANLLNEFGSLEIEDPREGTIRAAERNGHVVRLSEYRYGLTRYTSVKAA